jgi:WS/DGAT/MGAT family acyltransferase
VKPLSGLDGAFLHLETPATPMHVGSLHLFDRPPGYEGDFHQDVKRMLSDRMHLAPVFRRRLAPMPLDFANPVWVDAGTVDLDFHVRRVRLPRPGTQAQLEASVAELHAILLDRDRPLWMLYVFNGLKTGDMAYYFKIHHAVLDGAAGVALAHAMFDVAPQPRELPHPARSVPARVKVPGIVGLAAAAFKHDAVQYLRLVRHLPDLVRAVAGMVRSAGGAMRPPLRQNFAFGPKTPLNVTITGARAYAAVSLPLDTVKAIAASHEATVNDVVLTLCSGALRRYLAAHGGVPKKPLIATMPISLREAGNAEYTTQATLSLVNLATHVADPVRRLRAIRGAAGAMKVLARRARSLIPTDFPSIGVPWILGALASLYGRSRLADAIPPLANLVISNVPGPPLPLYAAGARMRAYWPVSIVEHGLGLNITVMSYAGTLGFGLTAARCAVPDVGELARMLIDAHEELKRIALPASARVAAKKPRQPKTTSATALRSAVKTTAPAGPAPRARRKRGGNSG